MIEESIQDDLEKLREDKVRDRSLVSMYVTLCVYRLHHLHQTFSFGDDASEVSEDNEPDIGAEYRISRVISRTGV